MRPIRTTLTAAALAVAPSQACLHFWGSTTRGPVGFDSYRYTIEDNGARVCNGSASDYNDRWLAHCDGDVSLEFTKDGKNVYYSAHGDHFSWQQDVRQYGYCCLGDCGSSGLYCDEYEFDTWQYC